MANREFDRQDCSLARALEIIGERWTLLIVRDAFYGVRRFNEFTEHLDIPRAVLTERLNTLVEHGVLSREPDPDHAGRGLYVLTAAGRALWPAVYALLMWGDRYAGRNSREFHHETCGSRLESSGACPTCGTVPGPGEIISRPRRGHASRRNDPVALALRQPRRLLEPLPVVSARR